MMDKFFEKLIGYMEKTEDFMSEQLPDFMQQFVAYEVWRIQWLFSFLLVLLIILIILQAFIIYFSLTRERLDLGAMFISVGFAGTFVLASTVITYIDLKKLEIAPKIYMIERLKEKVKP